MPTKVAIERQRPVGRGVLAIHDDNNESGSEESNSDVEVQDNHRRRRTKSKSSGKKPSKRCKKSKSASRKDDSSVESSKSVSSKFRDNKENHRRQSHSEMPRTTKNSQRTVKDIQPEEYNDQEPANPEFIKLKEGQKTLKLQEQALRIAELEKKLTVQRVKAHQPKNKKKKDMTAEELHWFRAISDANKRYNWHKVKFCNADTKLVNLTANIFEKWNLKEYEDLTGKAREEAKAMWIAKNQDHVRVAMNNVRNYAQSQVRNWVIDRALKGQMVPTPDQIRLCALRDECISGDQEMEEVFRLYHQELLGKILGKDHWDSWIRNYNTISLAKEPGAEEEFCCVPTSEAFLLALFDNCEEKWKMLVELKRTGKQDKGRKDKRWKTKYIDSDAGQAKWGGWNKAGRDEVMHLARLIIEARKGKHVAGLEQACLQRVQQDQGIVMDEDDPKGKKRKRKNEPTEEEEDDELDCI